MLRLFGRPLVQYSLDNALRAGVNEIVIIVGYRAEAIINAFGIDYKGVRVKYVIQEESRGLVNAMECAKGAIGDSDFMLFLADEILWAPKHEAMAKQFDEEAVHLAVTAHVRHHETNYDRLLSSGHERREARVEVRHAVHAILAQWEG